MPATVRRLAVAAVVVALALTTAACTDASPSPSASATPSAAAPIFANDEEALAAAEEAYARYNDAANAIGMNGGRGVESLESLVDSDLLAQSQDEFAQFAEAGLRIEGKTVISDMRLVERVQEQGVAEVSTYLCRDVSNVRVLDAAGEDVTPPDRQDHQALLATFTSIEPKSAVLLVSGLQEWTGDGVC